MGRSCWRRVHAMRRQRGETDSRAMGSRGDFSGDEPERVARAPGAASLGTAPLPSPIYIEAFHSALRTPRGTCYGLARLMQPPIGAAERGFVMASTHLPAAGFPAREYAAVRTDPARQGYALLRFTFTVAPILAGLDKFFHLLVNWDKYLSDFVVRLVGGHGHQFML